MSNESISVGRPTTRTEEFGCLAGLCGVFAALAVAFDASAATVKASSFGFRPDNATACLQKALDSGASRVVIDRQDTDWIIEPVMLRSNTEVVIEDGVTIRALAGAFKKKNDCLFNLRSVSNVVIRGEGNVRLIMNKKDYQDSTRYTPAEHRHTFMIWKASGIAISNVTATSSGGDGVYLAKVQDVRLENVHCIDHHRQGISVISARNLLVRNCSFRDTKGTPPMAGIDFEPNRSGGTFENVRFENCAFTGNASSGITLYLRHVTPTVPLDISFTDCISVSNGNVGISFFGNLEENLIGHMDFTKCRFEDNKVRNKSIKLPGKVKFNFTDCTIGSDQGACDFSRLRPAPKGTPTAPGMSSPPFWRKHVVFYQYIPRAGRYPIRFEAKPFSRKQREPKFHVEVVGQAEPLLADTLMRSTNVEYVIQAKHEDFVRIEVTPIKTSVRILSDEPGHGVLAATWSGMFRSPGSRLWFAVPAGVETVSVECVRLEPASVRIIAPDGTVAAELAKGVCNPKLGTKLSAKRPPRSPLEIWAVEFPEMVEDCRVKICEPCIPVVCDTPDAVLAPASASSELK